MTTTFDDGGDEIDFDLLIPTQEEIAELTGDRLEHELALNTAMPNLILAEPTAMIIDVNNFYKRSKACGFTIHYDKLLDVVSRRCNLVRYVLCMGTNRDDPQAARWIRKRVVSGAEMITKKLTYQINDEGREVPKANMDVEITMEAMSLDPSIKHLILGSCDGDFAPLVKRLREEKGLKVSVLGIQDHINPGISRALVASANKFYNMATFIEAISHEGVTNGHKTSS